jgi:glycosyltransferase involved in cell wall biosynthesis
VRLLVVTPYHAPAYAFGGPVQVVETQVRGLLAAGHDVTVATTDVLDEARRTPPDAPALPPGATVVRFPNRSHRLAMRTSAWTPRGWLPWIRANAASFDAIHLHDIYSVLSAGAASAAIRGGVPYVLQPHGSAAITAARSKPLAKRLFMRLWGDRTFANAAAVLYTGEHERGVLLAAGVPEDRLVLSPPPLELPEVSGVAPAAQPTIAFLGRLDRIKGVDRLLRAVSLARREVPDLRLEIMGPGERERPALEALAQELGLGDDAVFRGIVLFEAKQRALAAATLFALLSHSEGLPVAAVEAMACGTPVVLSEGCNLPEAHDRAGVVVSGEPEETAAAIVALLGDDERRARLAAGALEFAERFRADRVTADLAALFASLSSRGRATASRSAAGHAPRA